MKNIAACITFILFILGLNVAYAADKNAKLFQVATINSLAQGIFDSDYNYKNLMKHGNFGLGTFADIDGEMVAFNGVFYQIDEQGKVKVATGKQLTPFAQVTYFKPTLHTTFNTSTSFVYLKNKLV